MNANNLPNVKEHLKSSYTGDVYCYSTVGSTNDEAKRLVAAGAAHGTLVISDEQTSGRGRRGNGFFSPSGTGIYMSVIIKPSEVRSDVLYTIAAAVAARRVLDKYSEKKAEIKWVNDIYIAERKVCGILCEAVSELESGEVSAVICGIGVNLNKPAGEFPEDIQKKAGYITEGGVSRAAVTAELAEELLQVLSLNSEELVREYSDNMMLLSREIYYRENGILQKAKVKGVDSTGGLVVSDGSNETKILRSGEVHLEKF